jgi:spore photoproduct lyase
MDKSLFFPKKIYVTKDSGKDPVTQKILQKAPHVPVEFIKESRDIIEEVSISRDPVNEGKKLLLITHQKGGYVKPCPCTPEYIGCNYFIINTELNCPLDCSYCILQLYLNNPLITIHTNIAQLHEHIDKFLRKNRSRSFRIGTGELGDSLALDHLTARSKDLISYFAAHPNALFELKTKTVNIQNILEHEPPGNVVISWSLNSEKMAAEEEIGAPSVQNRIESARLVSQAGYRVGFHFDPIIHYPGWEDGYTEIIEYMMSRIERGKLAWISLGCLRFPPALKPMIQKRFPDSKIIYDEFILGKDGKLRYPKILRLQLFQRLMDDLKKAGGGEIPVYFCMESPDIWMEAQKKAPRSKKEVEKLLTLPLGAKDF